MEKALRVVVYIFLIAALPTGIFFLLPTSVEYHVVEKYMFSTNQDSKMYGLAVMLPKKGAYQNIENIQIEWPGEINRQTYEEVEVVRLERTTKNDVSLEAVLSYDVDLSQGKVRWEADIEEKYLHPQKDIESEAPELVSIAKEICINKKNNAGYQTYIFTSGYLSWPEGTRIGEGQSALTAYESKVGVCGEFANLMTALNRACGIPTKSISGLSMPMFLPPMMTSTNTWMHPAGAHAWVEVFTGDSWTLADPSWASSMPFDRIWFERSLGQYLSYGETGEHEKIYAEMMAWGEKKGAIIGAMSAPLKFVASSDNEQVTVTPIVSVKKVQDSRWIIAISSYILLVIFASLMEKRFEKLNLIKNAG